MESEGDYLVKSLFLQGSYSAAIATVQAEPSSGLGPPLYAARSLIAQNQIDQAAEWLSHLPQDNPNVRAVTLLCEAIGTDESVLEELGDVLDEDAATGQPGMVKAVAGIVYALAGETAEALKQWHRGILEHDQESVALSVQQYLLQDRLDAAQAVYAQAKPWLEDSLVSQLCEAWIGLRTGGPGYQSAFYVFDEVAQMPSANNVVVLQGKAIAQASLGNWPEAEAALQEAAQINHAYPHTWANLAVLATPSGKPAAQTQDYLARLAGEAHPHPLLEDLAHKSALFDEAAAKVRAMLNRTPAESVR